MIHVLQSYAKINLFLHILGKYSNGYHSLETIMSYINLYDILYINSNNLDNIRVNFEGEFARHVDRENNIITKTWKLFKEKYPFIEGYDVEIVKNIPVAAGLGGGSSNAAVFLLFLGEIYNIDKEELFRIALVLGADIPFFFNKEMQFCSGIGEISDAVNCNDWNVPILLINPLKNINTAEAFTRYNARGKDYSNSVKECFMNKSFSTLELLEFLQNMRNDLTDIAIDIVPEIKEILDELGKQDGALLVRMSGSGASCFAIFDNVKDMELAYEKIKLLWPSYFVVTALS